MTKVQPGVSFPHMALRPIYGHDGLRLRLSGAVARGQLPQVLLLEGPRGVGKQRLALWLAQRLVCLGKPGGEKPGVEPCGECQPCRFVLSLSHPDVHWIFPIELSKKSADADKQVDLVEEELARELEERRKHPLYEAPTGMAAHSIAAARLILRRLALTPALGSRKVFIVGDADRLVSQTGTDQAANALLKALEEPPANTVFLLTTEDVAGIIPTIRSRAVRVRVARLADSVVTSFAQSELGARVTADTIGEAEGCIGRLIAREGSNEAAQKAQAAAARLLDVAREGPRADRLALALGQTPFQARGGFTDMLDALLRRLEGEARRGKDNARVTAAIATVLDAREQARGNVNPQLLTAVLGEDLAGA